ncbi:MAG: hypothetical protein ACK5RL_15605 [Acidimicrobiales bacterium]
MHGQQPTNDPAAAASAERERATALQFTALVVQEYLDGTFAGRAPLTTRFPPSIANGEKIVCCSHYYRDWFGPAGDGSYSTFIAGGTGAFGVGLLAATAMASASARSRAARNARPAWRPLDEGELYVSDHGVYLEGRLGLHPFSWQSIAECDLLAPSTLRYGATMNDGTYHRFQVVSLYAELVMLSWAIVRHPAHPYLSRYLSVLRADDPASPPPPGATLPPGPGSTTGPVPGPPTPS